MGFTIDDDLLIRYLAEEVSFEEKAQVEQWRALSGENEKVLEQFYFTLQASERLRVMRSVDPNRALTRLKERAYHQDKKAKTRRMLLRLQRVAALLFLPVVISLLWLLLQKNETPPMQYAEVRSNPGIVTSFELPDGSKVWLNGGSSMRYPVRFSDEKREVQIVGQGYFEITHHPEKPFHVTINDSFSLEVLGTSFNLSAYSDEDMIETTLVEGSVKLNILQNDKMVQHVMQPKEKSTYSISTQNLQMAVVDPAYDIAWKDQRLMFKNHSMEYVMRTLGRYYNVRFVEKGGRVMDSEITGKFSNEQLPQVMEYLRLASGIKYRIESSTVENGTLKPTIVEIWK